MSSLRHATFAAVAVISSVLLVAPEPAQARKPIKIFEDDGGDDTAGPVIINGKSSTAQEAGSVIIKRGAANPSVSGGAMRLKFVRRGNTMYVKAKIRGRPVYFLVDTGASFTTLTPKFARSIGLKIPKKAPVMRLSTANGVTSSRIGVIDSMLFGGRPHTNVTFVECPTCGSGTFKGLPLVGLLGMNILGRYRMDVIEQSREIVFIPGASFSNRFADIEPWIDAKVFKSKRSKQGGKNVFTMTVGVANRAPRTVSNVEFGLICTLKSGQERRASSKISKIRAGKVATTKIVLTLEGDEQGCQRADPTVFRAQW